MYYSVAMLTRVLSVSRSGYYAWSQQHKAIQAKVEADRQLLTRIRRVHAESRGNYGVRRIPASIRSEGEPVNHKRVARLMRQAGLAGMTRRRKRPRTTLSTDQPPVARNVLNRQFTADRMNQKWCGDITYVRLPDGRFVYLAVVLDLYSRRIIGWSVLHTALVTEAQTQALWQRRPESGTILMHTDQGSQYQSREFRELLSRWGVQQSLSRRGNCWDNAVAESFFATLKGELLRHVELRTIEEARQEIGDWIDRVYNRCRLHSSLGYCSPVEYEKRSLYYTPLST